MVGRLPFASSALIRPSNIETISLFWGRKGLVFSRPSSSIGIRNIIENGRHNCPGCGAQFTIKEMDSLCPGWVNFTKLCDRLRWVSDAPIGSPQVHVSRPIPSTSKMETIPNKFVRQGDWFNRTYTRLELDRINRRAEMIEGQANNILQALRQSEKDPIPSKGTKTTLKESNSEPLLEDIADDEILMDSEKFKVLAEKLDAVTKKDLKNENYNNNSSPLICQRCHDLERNENISSLSIESLSSETRLILNERDKQILRDDLNYRSIVVLVVDLIDLPSSIPLTAFDLLKMHLRPGETFPSILIVGSKWDLMPKSMRNIDDYLLNQVRRNIPDEYQKSIMGVHLISSKGGDGIKNLCEHILESAQNRDGNVFLLGRTNVGKSNLFNSLLDRKQTDRPIATVSAKAGTTIGAIKTRLGLLRWTPEMPSVAPNRAIIDLPGIIDHRPSLASHLSTQEAKMILINNRIRASRRMLHPGETALFSGLIRISCNGPDPKVAVRMKLYMAPRWNYFCKPTLEVESFIQEFLGRPTRPQPPHLMPPLLPGGMVDERWKLFSEPKLACQFTVHGKDPKEVSFSDGFGWISFHLAEESDQVQLSIFTPNGVGVFERLHLAPQ